jgi:integrase
VVRRVGNKVIRKPADRYFVRQGLPDPTEIDPYEITFYSPSGEAYRQRSVADFPGLPNISRALLGAYFRKYVTRSKATQENVWLSLRNFITFLCGTMIPDNLASVDELVLREYLYSLKNGSTGARIFWMKFKRAEDLCLQARLARGLSLMKVVNPVPGVGRSGGHVPHFAPALLFAIIAAAKKEIRATWQAWEDARTEPANSPFLRLKVLLEEKYDGMIPINATSGSVKFEHLRDVYHAIKACGSKKAVEPLLYPTADSIIAFAVLLAYETAANADALCNFERDCIADDILFADRSFIRWDKARAGSEQRVSRDNRGYFSAPQLVNRVLEYTTVLTKHSHPTFASRLFLVRDNRGRVVPLSTDMANRALRSMAMRHSITWASEAGEAMSMRMMRPSVIAEVYRQTSDLFVTMKFANHASPQTTIRYIIDRITDEMHDVSIAITQAQLSKRVREVEQDLERTAKVIATDGLSFGLERDCANPRGAPASLTPGAMCPEWLWPLTDPGLIVPDDPKVAVHHVRMVRALNQLKLVTPAGRFALLYGDAHRIMTDEILPMLSPACIDAAELLANSMPAIELCEYE